MLMPKQMMMPKRLLCFSLLLTKTSIARSYNLAELYIGTEIVHQNSTLKLCGGSSLLPAKAIVTDYFWWATCTSLVTAFQQTRTQPCAGTSAPLQRVIVALQYACRSLTPDHNTLCLTRWLSLLLLCVRIHALVYTTAALLA